MQIFDYDDDDLLRGWRVMVSYRQPVDSDFDSAFHKRCDAIGECTDYGSGAGFGMRDHDVTYDTEEEAQALYDDLLSWRTAPDYTGPDFALSLVHLDD